jgi:hypothetical protein
VSGGPLDLATFVHASTAGGAQVSAPVTAPAATTTAQTAPDTAGIANAFAAASPKPIVQQASQIFHGLFQDTGRTAPVAAVVSQLWTTPNALPDTGEAAAAPPHRRDLRSLFSDSDDKT